MADAALVATGAGAAPLSYKVPGAAVIRIKQIHVAYADNSAGADWLPLVRIVSDSNHTMGQAADQAVKVTAGDDAAVTFHPGVKHAAAAAATTQSWLRIVAGASIPSGSISLQNGTEMPIVDFITNDSTRFIQTTASRWTMTRGVYAILGSLRSSTGAVVVADADFTVGVNSSSGFVAYAFGANVERVFTTSYVSMTLGDQSSLTPWKMLASGAETHSWYGQVDIVHVLGT